MAGNSNNATRILKLGIDEMFEDLTYNVAYNEVLQRLKANGMDDGVLKEAIDSGLTIMFSSALMLYIQKQEEVIGKIMNVTISALALLLSPARNGIKNLFRKFSKGRKFKILSDFFGSASNDNATIANAVATLSGSAFNAQQTANQFHNRANSSMQQRDLLLHSKDQQLAYAKAKADSFNQTLLFKILTSKFTAADKEIIRRITGGSADVDIESLNKIAEFMYVKDDSGNITGLSEQFMTMLNGLGYLNGKDKKIGG